MLKNSSIRHGDLAEINVVVVVDHLVSMALGEAPQLDGSDGAVVAAARIECIVHIAILGDHVGLRIVVPDVVQARHILPFGEHLGVVDVEGVPAQEAWDETEEILRYIRFTEEEMEEMERQQHEEEEMKETIRAFNILLGVSDE